MSRSSRLGGVGARPPAQVAAEPGPAGILGWAAYLACSWTWCIGMYLPVLMVRDYGAWGFVIFAVPNVVGAAAMGWVFSHPGASKRVIAEHRGAIACFSGVTIAFQLWFVWFVANSSLAVGAGSVAAVAAAFVVGVGLILPAHSARSKGVASIAVWTLSAGVLAALVIDALTGGVAAAPTDAMLGITAPGLIWLAPVVVFGFALCPYLDRTFHEVRMRAPGRAGNLAFTIGFGVLFLVMILSTLAYAGMFLDRPRGTRGALLAVLVAGHIGLQLGFTVGAHVGVFRESARATSGDGRPPRPLLAPMILGSALFAALAVVVAETLPESVSDLDTREVVYRQFMAFYGLVFPAYVWLCMIPTADGHRGVGGPLGRWKAGVLGVTVLAAAPFYWLGFIEGREHWLAAGLGVVLASRALAAAKTGRPKRRKHR